MNSIETEFEAGMSEAFEQVYNEPVEIDGRKIFGSPIRPVSQIEVVEGGWNEKVTHVFYSLKKYWPTGSFPQINRSTVSWTAGGIKRTLQIKQMNGNQDTGAMISLGLGNVTS